MAASQHAFLPASSSEDDIDDDVAYPHAPTTRWPKNRWMFALMVGIAFSGTALVAVVRGSSTGSIGTKSHHIAAISQLDEADPCAEFPQIKLAESPTNSKELNKDQGTMVIEGENIDPVNNRKEDVIVEVKATKNGTKIADGFGRWGKYYGVAALSGESFELTFSIFDKSNKPLIMPEIDITFFDLDKHDSGATEYIKLKPNKYTVSKVPLVTEDETADGFYKFMAEEVGDHTDNPSDPLLLTVSQKSKAVTATYTETSKFVVEMGSTGNNTAGNRGYIFVFRPSLKCAKTVGGGDDPGVDEKTPETPTTTPPVDPEEPEERNCLFIVPFFNWCFPKFW